MKTGMNLTELAQELERQRNAKQDYVAPCKALKYEEGLLKVGDKGAFQIGETAHEQISSRLDIPKKYYDLMRTTAPALLSENVNYWFQNEDNKYMVRTLDGKMRALLSDRYRPLDNFELAEAVLPQIMKISATVESCEITERRMYIKAVCKSIQTEVKKGDIVQAGIVISNSEIGCGSVRIEPMIFRLVCLNGMISADNSLRKYHVGRMDAEENVRAYFKDSTRAADDRAFFLKVRDIVNGTLGNGIFTDMVNRFKATLGNAITGDPIKTVEVLQRQVGLADEERNGILNHLLSGGDLNQFGLVNAVTRFSQDVEDYDRATELERLGGEIVELKPSAWKELSIAA